MLSVVSVCLPGPKRSPYWPEVDELHGLRLADDELRAALDFLVLVGKSERQRVARVVGPLDDVDELAADEIGQAHGRIPRRRYYRFGGFRGPVRDGRF